MEGYRIGDRVWLWMRDFLTNRLQCVIVNGTKYTYRAVTSGITQGSVLGSLLFLMFINDLPDKIIALIILFADDTKIFTRITSLQNCNKLQHDLIKLQDWSKTWHLRFSSIKCKVLRLGPNPPSFQYVMLQPNGDTVSLEESSCESDIGGMVDHRLKFG